MSIRFLDDIATADVAFEVESPSVEALFADSAEAFLQTSVADAESVRRNLQHTVSAAAPDIPRLLREFLDELIFLKDTEQLLLHIRAASVETGDDGSLRVTALGQGERIAPEQHQLLAEVKAVTYHRFEVNATPAGWHALVVLDV
mgnify:CR=1 FL=1